MNILNNASHLTNLSLDNCVFKMDEEDYDFSIFRKLRCLSLTRVFVLAPSFCSALNPSTFSKLSSLEIDLGTDSMKTSWMHLIKDLTRLEHLKLNSPFSCPLEADEISQLAALSNLRSLEMENIRISATQNLKTHIRKLPQLESLTCKAVKGTAKVRNAYEEIRSEFPNLKLSLEPHC